MQEQFKDAFSIISKQEIDGCITGSYMINGYQEGWNMDLDVFCFNEQSFTALLYFMKYNPLFQILDKLELHKLNEYLSSGKSSLDKLSLITIKYTYNLCVPVNVIYKKHQKNIFDVISAFDLDLVANGYDIKSGKTLSLREETGNKVTWNKWNMSYYKTDIWSCKRLVRQFSRVVKYTQRGYDVSEVTSKYISLIEDIINKENIYKSEKGITFHNETVEEFQTVLKLLKVWEKTLIITPEELKILENMY